MVDARTRWRVPRGRPCGSRARSKQDVVLAFFLPGIVYMADAVGTQTETLVVRGLSVGVPIAEVLKRELLTGLLVGVPITAVFVPLAIWRWGEVRSWLLSPCRYSTRAQSPLSRDDIALATPSTRQGSCLREWSLGHGNPGSLSVLIYFTIAVVVI